MRFVVLALMSVVSLISCKKSVQEGSVKNEEPKEELVGQIALENAPAVLRKHAVQARKNKDALYGLMLAARAQNLIVLNSKAKEKLGEVNAEQADVEDTLTDFAIVGGLLAVPAGGIAALGEAAAAVGTALGFGMPVMAVLEDLSTKEVVKKEAEWVKVVNVMQQEIRALKVDIAEVRKGDQKRRNEVWKAVHAYVSELTGGIDLGLVSNHDRVGHFYLLKELKP